MSMNLSILITLMCIFSSLISISVAFLSTAGFFKFSHNPSTFCQGLTPEGTLLAAVSEELWNDGLICGQMINVKCTGPTNGVPNPCKDGVSVNVTMVDYCPGGCGGIIDLSTEAFTTIANPVPNSIIEIDYQPI